MGVRVRPTRIAEVSRAMASLREATLRKLRRFSELRGTAAEPSSRVACTEGGFPRTPRPLPVRRPFLSALSLWLWSKHSCQDQGVEVLMWQ